MLSKKNLSRIQSKHQNELAFRNSEVFQNYIALTKQAQLEMQEEQIRNGEKFVNEFYELQDGINNSPHKEAFLTMRNKIASDISLQNKLDSQVLELLMSLQIK